MWGYSGNPHQCLSSCPFQTTTSSNRRVKQKTHKETHPMYLLRTLNNEAARLTGADTTANSPVTTLLRKAVFRDLKGFTWQALGSGSSVTRTTSTTTSARRNPTFTLQGCCCTFGTGCCVQRSGLLEAAVQHTRRFRASAAIRGYKGHVPLSPTLPVWEVTEQSFTVF